MATKTIAWTTGSGNITLTYTGQGNGSISVSSDANDLFEDRSLSFGIVTTEGTPEQALSILVTQKGKTLDIGTIMNFDYTGSVQQVTLPKGKYKLQCWGAQGGNVTGTYAITGSKGGYSEGVITITEPTTFYIFVGGQGTSYTSSSSQTSTTTVNGGWNGGGAGVRTARYSSGDTDGRSFPRGGGGATDISTVTSDLAYSSGRTTRDSASLLARCIVAGGGAGASARYTSVTTTSSGYEDYSSGSLPYYHTTGGMYYYLTKFALTAGKQYRYTAYNSSGTSFTKVYVESEDSSGSYIATLASSNGATFTVPSNAAKIRLIVINNTDKTSSYTYLLEEYNSYTSTSTSSDKSSAAQQGGGTSGKGQYPGTQSSGGNGNGNDGTFGFGGSQTTTGYRYCAGGGGGGWYGGGTAYSDSSTSYINYSGGGSGFVNTAANASYRPSGYTGLQLDSGTTVAGDTSFESTSGGTETGHSGNGYARITVLDPNVMDFPYSGAVQEATLEAGTYKLQCWGAEGGQGYSASYLGGAGGYSEGIITLQEETKVYLYVGGKGTNYTTSTLLTGGFNGGGNAYTASSSYRAAAGGGGTDIRIGTDSLYARVIVAGGGGGAGTYSSSSSYRFVGGVGGGVTGGDTVGYNTTYYKGYGGTATAGGKNYRGSTLNSTTYGTLSGFGVGGGVNSASSTYNYISGGGGGWYGGGYVYRAAAGGGSGYVYTESTASNYPSGCLLTTSHYLSSAQTLDGSNSFESVSGGTETGHRGNGHIRITKL